MLNYLEKDLNKWNRNYYTAIAYYYTHYSNFLPFMNGTGLWVDLETKEYQQGTDSDCKDINFYGKNED